MRAAYEELQISFTERESLECGTRTRMDAEMGKLQESNRNLRGEIVLGFKKENYFKMNAKFLELVC